MVGGNVINVLYEDNHVLVVEKPINIPVQADNSGDVDFLSMLKDYIKKKYHKPGNVYLGLVHRLDRPVGGVMVFAKTSKAASRLSDQVRTHVFKKKYRAIVMGHVKESDTLVDRLLKDNNKNMVYIDSKGKEAILSYKLICYINNMSLVDIELKTGRSHQIRVQFSSRGYPLYGDQRYNKNAIAKEQIALFAYSISFIHPTTKEELTFELDLPKRKPWNIFK